MRVPWNFISIAVSVAFGSYGVYQVLAERDVNVVFEVTSQVDVLDVRDDVDDLAVTFRGEDIHSSGLNLVVVTIRVANTGRVDILQNRYDANEIWGLGVNGGRIVEVRTPVATDSEYLRSHVNPTLIDEHRIQLQKMILEQGQFFIMEFLVLHPRSTSLELIPLGKIAGVDEDSMVRLAEQLQQTEIMQRPSTLMLFVFGMFGALAAEALRISQSLWAGRRITGLGRVRYIVFTFLVAALGGGLAVSVNPSAVVGALYIGLSAPLVLFQNFRSDLSSDA